MEVRSRNGTARDSAAREQVAAAAAAMSGTASPTAAVAAGAGKSGAVHSASQQQQQSQTVVLPPVAKSKPAQLGLLYKWLVVIFVTVFTTYIFEAKEFPLLEWLFSLRALVYTSAIFTMIGSLAFSQLRIGVFFLMVAYESLLVWIIVTGVDLPEIRRLINTTALAPLNETAYDTGCELYDHDHPQPFHNITDKIDNFVWLHIIGYVFKFLFLRSWWICHTLSVSFELAEYSLEHHLANFKECWWDHWIADALLSNVLGMWIGSQIITLTGLERYQWRTLIEPTVRGIPSGGNTVGRITLFRPRWTRLRNMLLIAFMTVLALVGEVNTFYIKFLLWLPPEHWYNAIRVLIAVSASLPAANELYHELQGRERRLMPYLFCLGVSAVQYTEMIAYVTLGHEQFTVPFPQHIILLWTGIIIVCVAYVIWRLVLRYLLIGPEKDELEGERHYEKLQQELRDQTNGNTANSSAAN
eukprot:scpid44595/ scgid26488/ Phosphatidylserine synthase 2; Serine-exchange enzyme II